MKGKKNWRLTKTLARNITFRPIEAGDVKYAWAAYKLGKLPTFPTDMSAPHFKDAFEMFVLCNTHAAWTVISSKPIGFVFGYWAPGNAYMIIAEVVWFPWATKRNIIEGCMTFFNQIRKEIPVMGFATDEHKGMYDVCCMHGIMSRAGTSHCTGQKMAIYEGRK